MKAKNFTLLAILLCAMTANVNAQARKAPRNEHRRIAQGVKSGELTKHETKTLVHQQKEIRQDKKLAKADGQITHAERKQIKREEKIASRNIYRKKHNDKDRN
ncbi:MAG: hypothetical protein ABIO82_00620 [Ginsengibacter sp.]